MAKILLPRRPFHDLDILQQKTSTLTEGHKYYKPRKSVYHCLFTVTATSVRNKTADDNLQPQNEFKARKSDSAGVCHVIPQILQ